MTDHTRLSCGERDAIMRRDENGNLPDGWGVESSLTDIFGKFGTTRIETTWTNGNQRIRDIRQTSGSDGGPDREPCEHYQWFEKESGDDD